MPNTLLFVCTGNYYRSRYAEILFNATKPVELDWVADSRGFRLWSGNEGTISIETRKRLNARGIENRAAIERWPLTLREADLNAATRVIALDATEHRPYVEDLFPTYHARFEFWDVADLDFATSDDALGRVEAQIARLIGELSAAR
jgi:protein-tyrosine phosphatase